jgi:IS5 family transposase
MAEEQHAQKPHSLPNGKPMPEHIARAHAAKPAIRARIKHVLAHQKNRYGLFIRTICLPRTQTKLTLSSLTSNFDRLIVNKRRVAMI